MSEYTRADVEAWLAENPWDMDVPEEVFTGTFGFQAFVLDRRTNELGGVVREHFESFMAKYRGRQKRAIRKYFRS